MIYWAAFTKTFRMTYGFLEEEFSMQKYLKNKYKCMPIKFLSKN